MKTNMASNHADTADGTNVAQYMTNMDETEFARTHTDILKLDEDPVLSDGLPDSAFEGPATLEDGEPLMDSDFSDDEEETVELSPDGILDEETIGQNLSNLGRSADGTQLVYLHVTIPGFSLVDISLLAEYSHLQRVEVPYNNLSDLTPLSHMPFLLELDASHNKITKMLEFDPPRNLKNVDLSYNQIEEMENLSPHHYLQKLNLDNNHISEIKGLERCQRLTHLSLAHNKIDQIKGFDNLPLKTLNLRCNNLLKIENLSTLRLLQSLNFSGNKIRSMSGLEGHDFLETVDLEDNEVIDLSEVEHLDNLRMLRQLNLQRNPIQELPDYRLSIIFHIQRLSELDRHRVEVDEKVAALNLFNPPMEVIAARDHIMHVVYNFLQPCKVLESTLPSVETPYPMLVLVGPQGSGKKDLALKLVEELPEYFGYGISHTTRKPHAEEAQGTDYHYISLEDFEAHIKMGKFLQTYQYHGNLYGLTIDSVEAVAKEGLACVTHMELEGVLTLKNTYFEPRYVLIMPHNRECHERRLRERSIYTEPQIEWTLNRTELYANHNRENPGFFDTVINSDDITEAYRRLRRLVMDYLGIAVQTPSESDPLEQSNTASQLEKEATETLTANSGLLGARTWSKPSIPDSLSQAHATLKKATQSPMPPFVRGVVEEESIKRRQSAAKEAVSGFIPSIYDQILSAPKTVPASVLAQQGLGDDEDPSGRAVSAPVNKGNMDALPPSSPDSSQGEAGTSSSLSNISDVHGMEDDVELTGSPKGSQKDLDLVMEAVDRLELMSGSAAQSGSGGLPAPRPPSGPRPPSAGSRPRSSYSSRPGSANRIGSDKHPVLPPISSPPPVDPLPEY